MRLGCLTLIFALLAATHLPGRTPEEFPQVEAAAQQMLLRLPPQGARLLPPYRNRSAWKALLDTHAISRETLVRQAERALAEPMPPFPKERFYDFSRNGNRARFSSENGRRWRRLEQLAKGELAEGKGRFLQALDEALKALCCDPTWVLSAHDIGLHNVEGRQVTIDLASARYGWLMAELVAAFNSDLPEATRTQVIATVRTRILDPYLRMARTGKYDNWWALSDANWNPVCHAGVVGTALALPGVTPKERARVVGSTRVLIRRFLGGFLPDGWTGEGVSYWSYGFGHFAQLCETVRLATKGQEDWLLWPEARKPAQATPTSRLCKNLFPMVADAPTDVATDARLEAWLALRLGLPARKTTLTTGRLDFPTAFLFIPSRLPPRRTPPASAPDLPPTTWFPSAQIWIARTPERVLMAMGGNNGVPHNHNDCGTFSLIQRGVPLITDLGGEEYTARTFSSRRYESPLLNSFGHPVPRPDETLQAAGKEASTTILAAPAPGRNRSRLILDLSAAYPVPSLVRLTREFRWEPKGNSARFALIDTFAFKEPRPFETALTTWGTCEQVASDRLRFSFEGESIELHVRASAPWHLVEDAIKGTPMGSKWQALAPKRYAIRFNTPTLQGTVSLLANP